MEVVTTLHQIDDKLADDYTAEQFARDVQQYTEHMEQCLRNLKIVGVVPKDQIKDPELDGIFVPLRIQLQGRRYAEDKKLDSLTAILDHCLYLVLLGGPGSGKSTAVRYLAWSHAAANQSSSSTSHLPLLPGNPLPLRIELRRLIDERRHQNYDFLSYASEVLLKREGIDIQPRMFKELLKRRAMLLLFDGLDEVATLHERQGLVEEIEHFASSYSGNRVIVTSRPVGYELAPISHPSFSRAHVQSFNDEQIRQFLENWYTCVLNLSPIPYQERQELETLLKALKENMRLHKLAENPLLLTVITALHRYERLPDRRVLIYDRCADLLLEGWAKLKGTNVRWKDLTLTKEDQYACVAHLGFVLHERSQADDAATDITSDVTTRVMLREIEQFLRERNLIAEVATQRAQAKLFIELMIVEAGLIVERGTEEGGESLYGFVHRTFQEYFAAADIYEHYQQEVDPAIISEFLKKHLHDPHWREVILLLLGKLKSKPVTNQLRQLLQGKIKTQRSQYTDLLQQDLFFVCDCLVEEIAVEKELAEMVVSRLNEVVKTSPFPAQCREALNYLGRLTQTRQYTASGRKALMNFVSTGDVLDIFMRIEAVRVLYVYSAADSEERHLASKHLLALAQRPDLPIEQALQVTHFRYISSSLDSKEERRFATQWFLALIQRPDLPLERLLQAADRLHALNPADSSEEYRSVIQWLLILSQRSDLSIEQTLQAVRCLYKASPHGSEEHRFATQQLLTLVQHPDLSIEQALQAVRSLYLFSPRDSEERRFATPWIFVLAQRPDLSIEQVLHAADCLCRFSPVDSEERHFATQQLLALAQHPDLSIRQALQVADLLYRFSPADSAEHLLATQQLLILVQHPDLSIRQALQVAGSFYVSDAAGLSEKRHFVTQWLLTLAQRPGLSIKQTLLVADRLCSFPADSEERRFGIQWLLILAQRPDLPIEQALRVANLLYRSSPASSEECHFAAQQLLSFISHLDTFKHEDRDYMYRVLDYMIPQFDKIDTPNPQPTP